MTVSYTHLDVYKRQRNSLSATAFTKTDSEITESVIMKIVVMFF